MPIIIKQYLGQCLSTTSVFPKHSSGVLRCIFRDLRIFTFCVLDENPNGTYFESSRCLPHNCVRSCGLNVHTGICVYNQMEVGGLLRTKQKQASSNITAPDIHQGQVGCRRGLSHPNRDGGWVESSHNNW